MASSKVNIPGRQKWAKIFNQKEPVKAGPFWLLMEGGKSHSFATVIKTKFSSIIDFYVIKQTGHASCVFPQSYKNTYCTHNISITMFNHISKHGVESWKHEG